MVDFLYRFSVLNTAFSVIGEEIKEKVTGAGRQTQPCLILWVLITGLTELWYRSFEMKTSTIYAGVFLLSRGYTLLVNILVPKYRCLSFADWKILRAAAKFASLLSFPMVFWFYLWLPLYGGITDRLGYEGTLHSQVAAVSVVIIAYMLCLAANRLKGNNPMKVEPVADATLDISNIPDVRSRQQRPISARTQARRKKRAY